MPHPTLFPRPVILHIWNNRTSQPRNEGPQIDTLASSSAPPASSPSAEPPASSVTPDLVPTPAPESAPPMLPPSLSDSPLDSPHHPLLLLQPNPLEPRQPDLQLNHHPHQLTEAVFLSAS
ncbi:hypothetical protein SLA2020_445250 [Shorea laevis]